MDPILNSVTAYKLSVYNCSGPDEMFMVRGLMS